MGHSSSLIRVGVRAVALLVGIAVAAPAGSSVTVPVIGDSPEFVGFSGSLRGRTRAGSVTSDGRTAAFEVVGFVRIGGAKRLRADSPQVWVRDLPAGRPRRVSVNSSGRRANLSCTFAGMSDDGKRVLFSSESDNLVDGDTNGTMDVFLRDRETGETTRVSTTSEGHQIDLGASSETGRSLSADGKVAIFLSVGQIHAKHLESGESQLVSISESGGQGNELSYGASISANGRFVAFCSFASDLVPGDTNDTSDIFVRDLQEGTTTRASIASDGTQANNVSWLPTVSDAGVVAFDSWASNLDSETEIAGPGLFLHDPASARTSRITLDGESAHFPSISRDGDRVVFVSIDDDLTEDDGNGRQDVFAWDTGSGTIRRLSRDLGGPAGNGHGNFGIPGGNLSSDGMWCVFDGRESALRNRGGTSGPLSVFLVRTGSE